MKEERKMKRLGLASALSMAASLLLPAASNASGFILIDTAAGTPAALIGPTVPIIPGPRPRPIVRPGPGPRPVPGPRPGPVLQGNVSFGLRLQSEAIKVDINDQIAKTYITQTFANDTDRNLAGTYMFPLPDDTTFSSFSLHIDGKPVEGKILEANEARQQYEAIVRQMIDPGLLEYADYKTVRARIFPIPAHGTKKVELEYTQILRAENGMLKYRFPLKTKGDGGPVEEVKIDAKLGSKQGLRTIWSPTHLISATRNDNNTARISFLGRNTVPDKDFLLYYSVSDKEMSANLLTHKNTGEDGYFLMTLTPPVKSNVIVGKDIVMVADTSGSMAGEKMDQCKKALKYIVNALNEQDRFSLVQFNTDTESFKSTLVPANAANKKLAIAFIDELEARGGTNISDALSTGTTILNQVSDRPAYLVMMTDGEPTVGETDVNRILKNVAPKRDVRIFDFGVGYDVNTKFLNKLAEEHHGTSQYVEPNENLETALSGFYQKIKSPVLSNVNIAYNGIVVKDVYPRSVKDIFAGTQVLLLGKYKGGGNASIALTGKVNGVPKAYTFPLSFATEEAGHTYLPRLWAMRRIGYLTDVAQANGNNKEVVDEIIALSKKYGIISAYTSFLVTEPNSGNRPIPMPVAQSFTRGDRRVRGFAPGGGGAGDGGFFAPREERAAAAPSPAPSRPALQGATNGVVDGRFKFAPNAWTLESPKMRIVDDMPSDKMYAAINKKISSAPTSGKDAVSRERAMNELKQTVALKEEAASNMKIVEEKTFYLRGGFWTDSSFEEGKMKPEVIEFGSNEYFDLMKNNPGISKYLSAGQQIILVYKGRCYKITRPNNLS